MTRGITGLIEDLIADFLQEDERSSAEPAYSISVVAERLSVHPNTLRNYERHGLLRPARVFGKVRRYSDADILRAGLIRRLTEDFGVDMVGARVVVVLLTDLRTSRSPEQAPRRPRRATFSG